jgi:hypothetical protein
MRFIAIVFAISVMLSSTLAADPFQRMADEVRGEGPDAIDFESNINIGGALNERVADEVRAEGPDSIDFESNFKIGGAIKSVGKRAVCVAKSAPMLAPLAACAAVPNPVSCVEGVQGAKQVLSECCGQVDGFSLICKIVPH